MTKVVNLDDYKPHLSIVGAHGVAHVIPQQCLVDVANGSREIHEELHDVIRGIVREHLIDLGVDPSEFGE